jgi:hypothetical protein
VNLPADIANQALDAALLDFTIGDLAEGTKPAQVLLRAYSQCLRQLLRAVHWNFARQQTDLVLLGDATGQTQGVGTSVIKPWVYEYAYPVNCMKARFVPWVLQGVTPPVPPGNITPSNPNVPIVTGIGNPVTGTQLRPARWLEAVDPNYPAPPGSLSWEVQGISPQGRTVILTNVQNAQIVFTALMNYPSNWDAQFRAAFVAYLASEIAGPLWSAKGNPKFGLQLRADNMKIAAAKIMQARLTDGNEGWHNSDFTPDWFKFRHVGGGERGAFSQSYGALGGGGIGYYYSGLDGCCGIGNTSAY